VSHNCNNLLLLTIISAERSLIIEQETDTSQYDIMKVRQRALCAVMTSVHIYVLTVAVCGVCVRVVCVCVGVCVCVVCVCGVCSCGVVCGGCVVCMCVWCVCVWCVCVWCVCVCVGVCDMCV